VHGVGRFRGVVTRELDHGVADYIVLEYAEGDRLYVPADQLDAVSKYVGGEVGKLHRLGTSDWNRQKAKVRKAVKDMADELIVLYSARASDPGFAFSPDQPWQAELEDAFPYVETRDQLSAIDDVKSDMERPSPMDRLICGDVGFGKTEIAIRAAFKAVMDQKQVAVLVPTTLLAQQHYATFTERFAPFPVRVAMLSRWVSAAEQQRLVDDLAAGKVDVIVGTHRILQKDLRFADLGLLIIDEEQRFGVAHKERLKQLKHSVDVLTMTATPIPRTLEMAMGGIRDMSVIDTPPEDRHPVLTFVEPYADDVVGRAIRREMLRDGQTFYVHNTVHDLDAVANRIQELVPDARIGIAHGQMDERRLESVMLDFWDRRFDVLVTTTIIESGLDIPTANTLIVENADRLGLAQLYQLRGRVGRSRERAYAYFLYPGEREMTETSHARLTAIGQLTDLGSGLQIALRDLEIRGAGNLLGGEQSGHIAAVGFDLYVRLLGEAIAEAKGTPQEPKPEVKIDLPLDAHLPEEWIPREGLRLDAYRRIASAMTEQDLVDVRNELQDRYGSLPEQAESLLDVARIRMLVGPRGARTVHGAGDTIRIEPLPLEEWEQVRAKRLIHGAIFKPATFTLIIPQPRSTEGGVARWLFAALSELFADDDD
jgi:transcription-repair coupling factor (superfamily II helicase)